MLYDNQNYQINDYLQKINDNIKKIKDNNNNSNNFLDDTEYDYCKKCKNNLNKYFCIKCQKNICDKCYEDCKEEKHILINLDNMKLEYENNINNIKKIINNNIIPIENEKIINNNDNKLDIKNNNIENQQNNFNDNDIMKEEDKNEDILLIVKIISIDYNNYFHYQNIEGISKYCSEIYGNNLNINYKGKGKKIYSDGEYYIGQFKYGLKNGKGILYSKDGTIKYEGDWINDKRQGYGIYYLENGEYIKGQ